MVFDCCVWEQAYLIRVVVGVRVRVSVRVGVRVRVGVILNGVRLKGAYNGGVECKKTLQLYLFI